MLFLTYFLDKSTRFPRYHRNVSTEWSNSSGVLQPQARAALRTMRSTFGGMGSRPVW